MFSAPSLLSSPPTHTSNLFSDLLWVKEFDPRVPVPEPRKPKAVDLSGTVSASLEVQVLLVFDGLWGLVWGHHQRRVSSLCKLVPGHAQAVGHDSHGDQQLAGRCEQVWVWSCLTRGSTYIWQTSSLNTCERVCDLYLRPVPP